MDTTAAPGDLRREGVHVDGSGGPDGLGRDGEAHLVAAHEHQVVPVGPELEC